MVKILQNVTLKTLCKLPVVCSILHIVLFVTGIDLDDIMQIDCLAYKFFVFYRFSMVDYNIWYCVVCDYRGTPPPPPPKQPNLHLSEIRISKIDNY